ncbi:hypothetical protein T459_29699 [Capsicum annuum]|uniref:EF-hand domain-containing protein n=1 Tax=Capsicum annuum TaxID=4072 RepID=A0A2G2Y6B2_CAPAN|nr:hypothetical protein T459_29699 [Capsicum annuum]
MPYLSVYIKELTPITYHREIENIKMPYKGVSLPITKDQLKGIFKKYDKDGDGKISKQELKLAFKEMGLNFPGLRAGRAIRHADINEDGYINEEEMGQLVTYASRWGVKIY